MYSEDPAPAAAEVALERGSGVMGRSMGNMGSSAPTRMMASLACT